MYYYYATIVHFDSKMTASTNSRTSPLTLRRADVVSIQLFYIRIQLNSVTIIAKNFHPITVNMKTGYHRPTRVR